MARTLSFTGTMTWPLESDGQAAKVTVNSSLVYASAMAIEKVYSATVVDEVIDLPMSSAKFVLLRAKTADVDVKLNGAATAVTLKADAGYLILYNGDGSLTGLTVSVATAPATLEGYLFS